MKTALLCKCPLCFEGGAHLCTETNKHYIPSDQQQNPYNQQGYQQKIIKEIQQKADDIKKEINEYELFKQKKLFDNSKGKQPYKCPCCDGYGKRYTNECTTNSNVPIKDNCTTCNATGVIWG